MSPNHGGAPVPEGRSVTRRVLRRPALLVLLAVAVAGCAAAPDDPGSTASATASPATPDGPGAPIDAAPPDGTPAPGSEVDTGGAANAEALSFTGVDLDGEPVDAAVHAGGDVVLWMWAPW